MTPNLPDTQKYVGFDIKSTEDLRQAGEKLLNDTNAEFVLVTCGSDGMGVFEKGGKFTKIPVFNKAEVFDVTGAGDTVTVHVRVVEGTHERIQLFEGVVIKKKGTGIGATYTVRKIASGVGVERTFPVNDPRVAKVEVKRHGRVRRAKLYYLRERHGKSARIAEARR